MNESGLPPGMPLDKQISHLLGNIAQLKKRIEELEAPTPEQTAEEKAEELRAERERRKRERDERHAEAAAAELQRARAGAIRAVAKLLPEAVRQAKAKPPRPALLRMILRATR
jgi:hypothetical protein